MKGLRCCDITNDMCSYVARGRTSWDVIRAMFNHAAKEHKELLIDLTYEDQKRLIDMMNKRMTWIRK